MAVQAGLENLPVLLSIVLLVMLLANPIYSWLVSKVKKDRIVLYTYLFFILNLLCFLLGWNFLDESGRARIAKVFYIWCNVYSFFVVSIFWVSMINFFQSHEAKNTLGLSVQEDHWVRLQAHQSPGISPPRFVALHRCLIGVLLA